MNKLTFCDGIEYISHEDGQYGSGRRIFITKTMNFKTNEESVRLAYAWGTKRNQFLFLPFCPACGVSLI